MQTFTRHRSINELKAECKKRRWRFNQSEYNKGSDHVWFIFHVGRVSGKVFFNSFNGRFFGQINNGTRFSSDETTHEDKPWFKTLLAVAYV